ncbi:ABC transporter ATP-binding protein [Candidatus Nanopelagicales bacterium]|nr:ABC transporter ATP-binding protein [Candidatus Nanopelagicales bacterium]
MAAHTPDLSSTATGLCVTDVSKTFSDVQALDAVSVSVEAGSMLVLLGPSGCGKTTLLRIIAGLERADAGTVRVGTDLVVGPKVFVPPEKRRIGMVFQDWALFPHLTVAKNVAYGLTRAQSNAGRVGQTLALMEMEHLADRRPDELSAGQAQRVALARALAPQPRLLLFDEPFSSLDAELRVSVRREVADLMRSLGMTAVFVTHDQEEAFVLGDQVAVMRQGQIVQNARPAQVYDAPETPWVAGFVGDANLISGRCQGESADTSLGVIPLRDSRHGSALVLARPEHLRLQSGTAQRVISVDFYGHDTTYRIRPDQTSTRDAELLVRAPGSPRHAIGDQVQVTYAGPPSVAFDLE